MVLESGIIMAVSANVVDIIGTMEMSPVSVRHSKVLLFLVVD